MAGKEVGKERKGEIEATEKWGDDEDEGGLRKDIGVQTDEKKDVGVQTDGELANDELT